MNNQQKIIRIIAYELFYSLTISWIVFSLLEIWWPSLVSSFININGILLFWFILGIFIVVDKEKI